MRYLHYFMLGWHYYCTDFCYFANFAILTYLNFYPNNEALFRLCYLFSQGALSVAIYAFRNSLVYHKIDFLTSLAIHAVPMTIMWHIRWITIPAQAQLNESERRFGQISHTETWNEFLYLNVYYPIGFYLIWVTVYGLVNFVIAAERIKRRNYDSTYIYFSRKPAIKKLLDKAGPFLAPIFFLGGHFAFFFISHIFAIIQFHFFWLNTLIMCTWLILSFWNGACFYMEYFAKKYEV